MTAANAHDVANHDSPLAPDCHGLNYYDIDGSLQDLLPLYLADDLRVHLTPHYRRLGEVAGGRLDELARVADRHGPVLQPRDRFGRDEEWIDYHPAFRAMEQIGYGDFGIHAMSRRADVLDWPAPVPAPAKYIFQYLFTQAEFGLMCPISLTDTSAMLIQRYGDDAVRERFLPRMLSQDMATFFRGAQFMTEKAGGSDVGALELEARKEGDDWRLYGDKWFCSSADADVALVLARPEGGAPGTRGIGLFALPKHLDDGSRNSYRIVRLKDKLGTRSMASGEILFDGAVAYPLGEVGPGNNNGLKQMMDQVNMSRLSHGVRAAGMMRRCLNEALVAARGRAAFGDAVINKPLMGRQLMKLMVPTEQALSMSLFTAAQLEKAAAGNETAAALTRILTPLLKFRACRDNITVATGALEARGGNGYIEDFVNARLVRDAQLGVLWEGTSNINALDAITRAVGKVGAHTVRERYGMIFMYRNHAGTDPDYDLPVIDGFDANEFTTPQTYEFKIRIHGQDIMENSVDSPHFWAVHGHAIPVNEFHEVDEDLRITQTTSVDRFGQNLKFRLEFHMKEPGFHYVHFPQLPGGATALVFSSIVPVDEEYTNHRLTLRVRKSRIPGYSRLIRRFILWQMMKNYSS